MSSLTCETSVKVQGAETELRCLVHFMKSAADLFLKGNVFYLSEHFAVTTWNSDESIEVRLRPPCPLQTAGVKDFTSAVRKHCCTGAEATSFGTTVTAAPFLCWGFDLEGHPSVQQGKRDDV